MTDESACKRKPPETSVREGMQPKGHSRSCTARAKGWKTGAKRNVQSRNQPDRLQAILTQHTWQAKEGILPQTSSLCALFLPNPQPPEWSYCPPTALFSSFSPNFCQILLGERQKGHRAGAMGFVCSGFQTSQGAFPSPTGPPSQRPS